MSAPTTTTTTPTTPTTPTTITTKRELYEEGEHEALEASCVTGRRVAAAMNAADTARQALEATREEELHVRVDLPKKQKAYLAIKDSGREVLRVRRQAFKARVRAAGMQTTFISSLSEKDMEAMVEEEEDAADPTTTTTSSPKKIAPPTNPSLA